MRKPRWRLPLRRRGRQTSVRRGGTGETSNTPGAACDRARGAPSGIAVLKNAATATERRKEPKRNRYANCDGMAEDLGRRGSWECRGCPIRVGAPTRGV
ncbi:hypothetical protein NDU88_005182 [Pleurodeles waltl]|uniref:Uncharacterized protein n=1 Tax=Pleurodeles waltl TaxID=8319 RepID=A0AAV7QDZ1_PLEWA|nr:hypothetical protein NDU88_005182 [Pleurodeles waltl]